MKKSRLQQIISEEIQLMTEGKSKGPHMVQLRDPVTNVMIKMVKNVLDKAGLDNSHSITPGKGTSFKVWGKRSDVDKALANLKKKVIANVETI